MSREAYVRYTWEGPGIEVVVGLEWRDGEDPDGLWNELEFGLRQVITATGTHDDIELVRAIEDDIVENWPDRAYFMEVGDGEYRHVQVYDPRGFVKERCPCVGATQEH